MKSNKQIRRTALLGLILILLSVTLLTQCKRDGGELVEDTPKNGIILGFSQIGAESAWRKRNTQSIVEAAEESGIQLLFDNAEQKQENQIKAMR